jgi:hypothetical protein
MSPLAPLLAAFFLAPVPQTVVPPAFAIFAKPDEVMLVLATNRSTTMRIADPKDLMGLPYSLMFIRVRGPDGEMVWTQNDEGWWTPLVLRSQIDIDRPEPWEIEPGEIVTLRTTPAKLLRGLRDGPTSGACRFQTRAVIRDYDQWPWAREGPAGGAYTVESNWVDIPCADLFPPR